MLLDIILACDAMMDLEGGNRPAVILAYELVKKGYNVSIVSPIMSYDVEKRLNSLGITTINFQVKLFSRRLGYSFLWFELWFREAFLRLNSRHVGSLPITINFSHTFAAPSNFWYVQGPTSVALQDAEQELIGASKFGYKALKPIINWKDKKLVMDSARKSLYVVANSKFCASIYRKWGINVNDVIYPPIDRDVFQPSTSNPSSDYILTYFGKETEFSAVKAVADLGIKIKAFGAKSPFIPKSLINHPYIEILGRIPAYELVTLYSNALFTLFPFTHEPFGYVPVESMACGTPVLTYNSQGPRESVINGYSGWLVESRTELIQKAVNLWRNGYDPHIRLNCINAASRFDKEHYVKKWLEILRNWMSGQLNSITKRLKSVKQ
ncbi:MAG: glycosyltransferase [Candidatus Bathyarchaeia archaeon]